MSQTSKALSQRDANQILQAASVGEDDTLMVSGFLAGKVGRKVTFTTTTTTVAGDTQVVSFSESGLQLSEYTLIYVDSSQNVLLSAERTA